MGKAATTPIEPFRPLHAAALKGNLETLKSLLNNKSADVDAQDFDGTTALILASANNQLTCVKELLKRGANPALTRKSGTGAMFFASQGGFAQIVSALLRQKSPVDQGNIRDQGTPLLAAAQNGHVECCELLLDGKARVDAQMIDGASPLFLAAQSGYLAVVDLMVSNGAQINLSRKDNASPLYIAAQMGHTEVCGKLLKSGAKVDSPREDGATGLFKASQKGHVDVVQLLLDNGAAIGLLGNGESALHAASLFGRAKICHLLLVWGSDPSLKNKDGMTPTDLAREIKLSYIVSILDNFAQRQCWSAPVTRSVSPDDDVDSEHGQARFSCPAPIRNNINATATTTFAQFDHILHPQPQEQKGVNENQQDPAPPNPCFPYQSCTSQDQSPNTAPVSQDQAPYNPCYPFPPPPMPCFNAQHHLHPTFQPQPPTFQPQPPTFQPQPPTFQPQPPTFQPQPPTFQPQPPTFLPPHLLPNWINAGENIRQSPAQTSRQFRPGDFNRAGMFAIPLLPTPPRPPPSI